MIIYCIVEQWLAFFFCAGKNASIHLLTHSKSFNVAWKTVKFSVFHIEYFIAESPDCYTWKYISCMYIKTVPLKIIFKNIKAGV